MRKILLRYSPEKSSEPILASVIKDTGVLLNVLQAKVNSRGGEIIVAVEDDERVPEIIRTFQSRGVAAEELKLTTVLNRDACMDCGACLSLCPTKALRFNPEYRLELDKEKCVYCKLCIEACPVRALSILSLE